MLTGNNRLYYVPWCGSIIAGLPDAALLLLDEVDGGTEGFGGGAVAFPKEGRLKEEVTPPPGFEPGLPGEGESGLPP